MVLKSFLSSAENSSVEYTPDGLNGENLWISQTIWLAIVSSHRPFSTWDPSVCLMKGPCLKAFIELELAGTKCIIVQVDLNSHPSQSTYGLSKIFSV